MAATILISRVLKDLCLSWRISEKEYGLPDRRGTTNYKQWDNDVEEWEKLMLLDKHRKVGL